MDGATQLLADSSKELLTSFPGISDFLLRDKDRGIYDLPADVSAVRFVLISYGRSSGISDATKSLSIVRTGIGAIALCAAALLVFVVALVVESSPKDIVLFRLVNVGCSFTGTARGVALNFVRTLFASKTPFLPSASSPASHKTF